MPPIAGIVRVGFGHDCGVSDAVFADPRLAVLYDVVDDDRSDLDMYVDIVAELGASSVLDVGCGTGTLACRLAQRGISVTGIDPAAASLDASPPLPPSDGSTPKPAMFHPSVSISR